MLKDRAKYMRASQEIGMCEICFRVCVCVCLCSSLCATGSEIVCLIVVVVHSAASLELIWLWNNIEWPIEPACRLVIECLIWPQWEV